MTAQTKQKGLRIATRCTSVDQFVAAFSRFCDEQTFFVSTLASRPIGLETAFSVDLAGGEPVLRGTGIVLDSWPTEANLFGRPGLRLGVRRLTAESEKIFQRLIARDATPKPVPLDPTQRNVQPAEHRTPGSELILPANPLMNLSDESLEGFVDCTLYEGTGSFFPVDPIEQDAADDPTAPPPPLLAPRPAITRRVLGTPPAIPVIAIAPRPPIPPPIPPPAPEPVPIAPAPEAIVVAPADAPIPYFTLPAAPPPSNIAIKTSVQRWWIALAAAMAVLLVVVSIIALRSHTHRTETATAPPAPPIVLEATPAIAPPPTPRAPPQEAAVAPTPPEPSNGDESSVVGTGPCRLAISSTPAGSIVAVDAQQVGPSPITIAGPCARRRIDVSHPRYAAATRWVTLTADHAATLDVSLARPTHDLWVDTRPWGAELSIDGHRAGTSPGMIKVMGFTTVTLQIEKPGFKRVAMKVYSKVEHDKVFVKMAK